MLEHIITYITLPDFLGNVLNHIELFVFDTNRYVHEEMDIKVISIALMLFAFFLFFITLLFVSLRAIFSSSKVKKKNARHDPAVFFDDDESGMDDYENEMQHEAEQKNSDESEKENLEKDRRVKKQLREKESEEENDKKEKKNSEIKLDWEKGKIKEIGAANPAMQIPNLEYKQSEKELNDLVGLIMDMISRGVDDLKIAQTIMYRNKGKNTEDDILQTIETIKAFISLCNNRRFIIIKNLDKMPGEKEALTHWAKGDASLVMILLQALIDEKINRSANAGIGAKRDALFKEASDLAFYFGAISYFEDFKLAINALELSIELDPNNIGAWNKVADAYFKLGDSKKAAWAYRNVLKVAKDGDKRYAANASRALSKVYLENEEYEKAEELFNISKEYYDQIGINKRLDKKEIEIVGLIEAKQGSEIGNVVNKVLEGERGRI